MIMEINLEGYRTYLVAIGTIMWAVGGFAAGKVDGNTAIQAIFIALGMMGLRSGIAKAKTTE